MRIEDFTQYLLWEKKYSPHTVEAYGTDLSEFEGFLVSMQAPAEDASIDFQAVRAWVVHLMEQGYTPSSVNRKISALRSYFKYLLRRGAIRISPMMRQGNLKEPYRTTVPYSVQEMQHLLDPDLYRDDPDGERDRLIVELFYGCGLRCAELCDVRLGDVDFRRAMLRVRGKGGKERFVPMHPRLCEALGEYLGMSSGGDNVK